MQGRNVKKLIAHKMSLIMIPPGCGNGLATGIAALMKPGNVGTVAREATQWVEVAIAAVRQAGEPNPWKTASDEDIAAEILRQIEEKKKAQRKAGMK